MESKKLEALLMAVDLGSFTKAAEVMGYTQSGLTHMMNSLEREVGFTLLERGARRRPPDEGRRARGARHPANSCRPTRGLTARSRRWRPRAARSSA